MWEERWHPLREEWVIVAAHRQSRPWSGAEVRVRRRPSGVRSGVLPLPRQRAGGRRNEPGIHRHVRVRQRSSVRRRGAPRDLASPAGIYRNRPATGVARVVCYSPRHDVTLAELDVDGVDALLETWQQQMRELATHRDVDVRPDLREQGRGRRRQQPAPALSDLRDQFHLQIHRDGALGRPPTSRETGRHAVPGHPGGRASGRAADRLPARQRDCVRAVLCALRLRDVRGAASERPDHCGSA